MEPTSNSPPPYQREDLERLANDFNNLQQFAQHENNMIVYRSDYQIFDNSWKTWKLLETTKRRLQLNIAQMQTIIENTNQEQTLLMQKANHYFHILNTPEIQRRVNPQQTTELFQHPNTPILRPLSTTPPPIAQIEEISLPNINIPESRENMSQRPPLSLTTCRNHTSNRYRQCRSTRHQKRNCPRYQCLRCLEFRPGHYTHECPNNEDQQSGEDLLEALANYDDYDYDPDGNLDGER